jgi:hypothetical protein
MANHLREPSRYISNPASLEVMLAVIKTSGWALGASARPVHVNWRRALHSDRCCLEVASAFDDVTFGSLVSVQRQLIEMMMGCRGRMPS